jgi:hypothetical protein
VREGTVLPRGILYQPFVVAKTAIGHRRKCKRNLPLTRRKRGAQILRLHVYAERCDLRLPEDGAAECDEWLAFFHKVRARALGVGAQRRPPRLAARRTDVVEHRVDIITWDGVLCHAMVVRACGGALPGHILSHCFDPSVIRVAR